MLQERTNNVPRVTYTRGRDLSGTFEGAGGIGGLLARTSYVEAPPAPTHAYYHHDGNGNVTMLVDGAQRPVARYLYDPYGNLLAKDGILADANVYRFSSKEWHERSGNYHFGFRFYNPALQRWLNPDPLGEEGGDQSLRIC